MLRVQCQKQRLRFVTPQAFSNLSINTSNVFKGKVVKYNIRSHHQIQNSNCANFVLGRIAEKKATHLDILKAFRVWLLLLSIYFFVCLYLFCLGLDSSWSGLVCRLLP